MNDVESATVVRRAQAWSERAVIVVFLAFIALPVLMIRPETARRDVALHEKRPTIGFPRPDFSQGPFCERLCTYVRGFPRSFEACFNDYVGLRRRFIQIHTLGRLCGVFSEHQGPLGSGRSGGASCILGKNGWLYFSGHFMKEDFTASMPFSDAELDRWAQAVEARAAWLAERGALYVLMLAPNPHTIYPENVPERIGRHGRPSRMDQLKARLAGIPNFEFVDVREPLIEAKGRLPPYRQTDTHWNDYGAYIGYQTLMTHLGKHLSGVEIAPLEDYEVVTRRVPQGDGDLARMLDVPSVVRSLAEAFNVTLPTGEQEVKLLPTKPLQAQLLWQGATGHLAQGRPTAPLDRAVVLHDSFYPTMHTFLQEHWRRISCHWQIDFSEALIEQERPDVVIHEMAEKMLTTYVPELTPGVAVVAERLPRSRPEAVDVIRR